MALALTVVYSCSKDDLTSFEEETKTEEAALRKGNTPAASGQGTIEWPGIEGKRHFSFHARTNKDGSVSGSGVLTYTKGDLKVKFSIDCITVNGNTAVMAGNITSHSTSPENVGLSCSLIVRDNGEGKNADPDQMQAFITYTNPNFDSDCDTNYAEFPFNDVLEGNVQVGG